MGFNKGNAEFRANAVSVAALILTGAFSPSFAATQSRVTLASCNGTVVLIK